MAALVPALVTLRSQFNNKYPNRNKASDGWIGDAAHASRKSYHNPDNNGWVHALDITHDPGAGVDIDRITDELVASGDSRILELIANGLYWHHTKRKWVTYYGSNPHRKHFHITAKPGPSAMNNAPWQLASFGGVSAPAPPASTPVGGNLLRVTSPRMHSDEIKNLQRVLNAWYPDVNLTEDGWYGPETEEVVKMLQRNAGIYVDGIVGNATRKVLGLA